MKSGTWRIDDKDTEEDKGRNHFPDIDDKEPLALLTLSNSKQVEYDEYNVCKPVICQ